MKLTTSPYCKHNFILTFTYIGTEGEVVKEMSRWSLAQLEMDLSMYIYKHNLGKLNLIESFRNLKVNL